MESYTTTLIDAGHSEVLVVGGGPAGVLAALGAARLGASVTLVERYGFLGGNSTQVLDRFCGFFTLGSHPKQIVGGIPDEVLGALFSLNAAELHMCPYSNAQLIIYNPEILKVVWDRLVQAAGITVLAHSFVVDAVCENDRVTGVIAANKSGLVRLQADVIIDASGDADVAARAGAPFDAPDPQTVQALTTTFKLFNVDTARAGLTTPEQLHRQMAEANARGDYDLPRHQGSASLTNMSGVIATNMTRIMQVDATDARQLSDAEVEGRRQAMEYVRFLNEQVPGYERAELSTLNTHIGIRETRRIVGQYRLTREDVFSGKRFDDVIAKCAWPVEDHHAQADTRWERLADDQTFDIPFRCLVPQHVAGLLVAGRCLSADHDAHASVRVMAQCMAMGQAAGAAAALAVAQQCMPADVPINVVQAHLRAWGALL